LIYLYDPRTNLTTLISVEDLVEMSGHSKTYIKRKIADGKKIKNIGCYVSVEEMSSKQRKKWYESEEYQDEAWKEIIGSDGKFKISNYGRVKRVYKNHESFMLPYLRKKKGNLYVKAMYKNKYSDYKIGLLVAVHFLREPKEGEFIVRKNGIITDDYVGNLQFLSKVELGKKYGHKAKSKEVVQIDKQTGEIINEFRSAREAGRKTNFSYQAILDRCNKVNEFKNDDFLFLFAEDYEREFGDIQTERRNDKCLTESY
jgi:NUMOD4 motif